MHVPVQSFTAAALGYLFVIHIQVYMEKIISNATPNMLNSIRHAASPHRIRCVKAHATIRCCMM